jgi:hypothetical protein
MMTQNSNSIHQRRKKIYLITKPTNWILPTHDAEIRCEHSSDLGKNLSFWKISWIIQFFFSNFPTHNNFLILQIIFSSNYISKKSGYPNFPNQFFFPNENTDFREFELNLKQLLAILMQSFDHGIYTCL